MSDLRGKLIRLAHEHPEFRKDILPLLKEAGCEKLPEGGMRDNCEAKKEEGKDKTANSRRGKTAFGPDPKGRNWLERQRPPQPPYWIWDGHDGVGPTFSIIEKPGPVGPIYKLQMGLPDGKQFETQGQKTSPDFWFRRAAQLYADWFTTGGVFDLSQTPERWSKLANFPAQDIGKTVSGPSGVPGSDAQKPWSKGEFTQQEFVELDERQESGDMSGNKPNLEPMKVAQEAFRKARLAGKSQDEAKAIAKKAFVAKKADFEWFRGMVNQKSFNQIYNLDPGTEEMSNLRSRLIRLAHEHPEFRKDLLPLIKTSDETSEKQAKVGPQKFIGEVGGYLYAVKVPGLDPDDLTKRGMSGIISANASIKAWRAEGGVKEAWILTKPRKGQKPGPELRKWLMEVNPSEFYARWDLSDNDDTRQIFYKP